MKIKQHTFKQPTGQKRNQWGILENTLKRIKAKKQHTKAHEMQQKQELRGKFIAINALHDPLVSPSPASSNFLPTHAQRNTQQRIDPSVTMLKGCYNRWICG